MYLRYDEILKDMKAPEILRQTEDYLTEKLQKFLRRQERILICFSTQKPDSIGSLLERAARRAGAIPLLWNGDYRWKALLKQAFDTRATAIAGPPLVILGLTKLARATRTPLNFRHVLTAGYPCLDWMIEGICRGLDCETWGCFGPGTGPVVSGFSCGKSMGVHVRDDFFTAEIVDEKGELLPEGELGYVVLRSRRDPSLAFRPGDRGRLNTAACSCGSTSPRLMDLDLGDGVDMPLLELSGQLLSWTSILDCRIERGECGLELELVVFPGEKLPKLPTVARQIIRPWDPETDKPFMETPGWKMPNNG